MSKETYCYRKGKERLRGGKIIRINDINPWEFRGHFEGEEGINFVFQYKDVKKVKGGSAPVMTNMYPMRDWDDIPHPLEKAKKL